MGDNAARAVAQSTVVYALVQRPALKTEQTMMRWISDKGKGSHEGTHSFLGKGGKRLLTMSTAMAGRRTTDDV
jgi:hypothetical protein